MMSSLSIPGSPLRPPRALAAVFIAAATFFATLPLTDTASHAQARRNQQRHLDNWQDLGCTDVGRRRDFDVIEVGRREGFFTAIRLRVTGNDVRIDDLRVIYGNGSPDNIRLRSHFREGSGSRVIDLKGNTRLIQRLEIVAKRTRSGIRGRARVCFEGLMAQGRRPGRPIAGRPGAWEELGCQKVGFVRDRDIIRVGRREGRFRALRLEVTGNDVFLEDLTVVYGNGAPDRLPVRALIRENEKTRPLDLTGRRRAIQHIEMVYRRKVNFRGSAQVCVSGIQ